MTRLRALVLAASLAGGLTTVAATPALAATSCSTLHASWKAGDTRITLTSATSKKLTRKWKLQRIDAEGGTQLGVFDKQSKQPAVELTVQKTGYGYAFAADVYDENPFKAVTVDVTIPGVGKDHKAGKHQASANTEKDAPLMANGHVQPISAAAWSFKLCS